MPPKSVLPSPREQKRFLDNFRQRMRESKERAAADESQETPISKKESTLLGRA